MEYILETEGLTKTYSGKEAAKDINIHIRKGDIYGLIGRNGAGKTTIMRMLSGLSRPSAGTYRICGKDGAEKMKYMRKVGVLIEHPGLYPNRSAAENLKIKCIGMGADTKCVPELLKTVGLENTGKKEAGSFSLGMRQRLGIALALVGDPELIILDEPINGLDPQGIVEVRKTLERLRREKGITIMISSHILDELGKLANRYGIIHEGRLIDEFSIDDLHERCEQYILINSDNNDGVIKALHGIGITKAETDDDGFVRVSERIDESALMAKTVINANIALKEIYFKNFSLEDYYLSVTGGNHNG